jgi:hypothetical protein
MEAKFAGEGTLASRSFGGGYEKAIETREGAEEKGQRQEKDQR